MFKFRLLALDFIFPRLGPPNKQTKKKTKTGYYSKYGIDVKWS
jgi:hypothetical protein